MKKLSVSLMVLGMLAASGIAFRVAAVDQPKKEMVTGDIQCLYCYMARADMGSNPSGCVDRCINKKMMSPIIVQEGTNEIFVAVWKNGESATAKLTPLIGKKINAQGTIYRKNGLNVIEIGIVSEAL